MGTERFDELDKLLHQMPLPQLGQEKSEKMYTQISKFNRDYQAQPRKQKRMSRWGIGLASIAAALLLLFFTASFFGVLGGKESNHPIAGLGQTNGQPDASHNAKAEQMRVVKQWAEGVKQRDGRKQYKQFSPELQKKYQQVFEDAHWSTGTSSPWVKSYEIFGGESNTYKVIFHMMSSTGDAGDLAALVYLEKAGSNWMIAKTSSSTPYLNYDLSSNNDDETLIKEFRSKQNYAEAELAHLSITLLGVVDDYRVYNVPFKGESNATSFKVEGYEFPPASGTNILGVKNGKVFTIGEMINEGSIDIKKLYELLPLDLQSGEQAIDLQAQAVVTQWADGVKMRDGKQQFKMLSSDLQEKYKSVFTQNNWSTGTSSPWVNGVDIKKDPSQAGAFDVTFQMASSTGDAGKENAVVHLEKVDKKWVITEIASDIGDFNLNLSGT